MSSSLYPSFVTRPESSVYHYYVRQESGLALEFSPDTSNPMKLLKVYEHGSVPIMSIMRSLVLGVVHYFYSPFGERYTDS